MASNGPSRRADVQFLGRIEPPDAPLVRQHLPRHLEIARVAVLGLDDELRDRGPHRPSGARLGRALHAAGRVDLARLPRPEALAVEIIEAQRLPRFLLLDPIDEFLPGAGFQAPEDLRDGALGQALRGGDFWR